MYRTKSMGMIHVREMGFTEKFDGREKGVLANKYIPIRPPNWTKTKRLKD